jgi:hypothetical protein
MKKSCRNSRYNSSLLFHVSFVCLWFVLFCFVFFFPYTNFHYRFLYANTQYILIEYIFICIYFFFQTLLLYYFFFLYRCFVLFFVVCFFVFFVCNIRKLLSEEAHRFRKRKNKIYSLINKGIYSEKFREKKKNYFFSNRRLCRIRQIVDEGCPFLN